MKVAHKKIDLIKTGVNILLAVILFMIALLVIMPLAFSFFGALKENMELMVSNNILPKKITFENYRYTWSQVDFARYTFNSVIVTGCAVAGSLLLGTMTAYVFSRKGNLKTCKMIRAMYIATMFISLGPATIYPVFKLMVDMKLNNTYMALIITQIMAQTANIIMIEGYLSGISKEFDEAARVDGCGFFRIYWNIILPLITPVLAVVGILVFTGSWNNYMMPMILTMGKPKLMTLTAAVVQLKNGGQMATLWSVLLAGANISIIPIVIIFIFANKYFVAGLTLGGIKG